jgi:sterol desaturase/sphingolipid hydroxylase (fatty acid hydroxylase superfamily)
MVRGAPATRGWATPAGRVISVPSPSIPGDAALVPTAAVGMALIVTAKGWGLFVLIGLPYWSAFIVGVLALDFVICTQRYTFHDAPLLWRLHRMLHADIDIDVTTGVRCRSSKF